MYAIARIAGKQFRIEPDLEVIVPRLSVQEGSTFEISEILLTADGDRVQIGQPILEGVTASARVVSHGRAPKQIVFKKKRRKGFEVTKGHRQGYTLLRVEKIQGAAKKPKAELKPEVTVMPRAKSKAKAKKKAPAKKKKAPAKSKSRAKK